MLFKKILRAWQKIGESFLVFFSKSYILNIFLSVIFYLRKKNFPEISFTHGNIVQPRFVEKNIIYTLNYLEKAIDNSCATLSVCKFLAQRTESKRLRKGVEKFDKKSDALIRVFRFFHDWLGFEIKRRYRFSDNFKYDYGNIAGVLYIVVVMRSENEANKFIGTPVPDGGISFGTLPVTVFDPYCGKEPTIH